MEAARPLFWHQGLFLQPQHFQLAERYLRSLLLPFQEYLTPHFWGVCRMNIGSASLGNGSFQLKGGSFLFPDGTFVLLPGNGVVEARRFDEGWVEGGKPLTAYLGLRCWNDAAGNVTVLESSDTFSQVCTRFAALADAEPCPDLHAGGPRAEVARLDLVLKIFWENELDRVGDYLLIPVARLERTRDGIELSRHFVPPCVTLGSSQPLLDLVQEISDELASRCRQLEAYKRQRGIQTAEFGSRDVVYLLALRTLNRYLPRLVHSLQVKEVHPWQLYGTLRELVGELTTFSETVTVLGDSALDGTKLLPDYDHLRLGECFNEAHALILRLLDEITAGPEYVLPLTFDGSYFSSELKPVHLESRNRFFLVLKTEEDPRNTLDSLGTAKLASRGRLELLIARALPGIALEHLANPPRELPRRRSCIYFAIDHRCEQWDLVRKETSIALFWDRAPEDLQLELMVVGRG